jgi:hypothetical protein
MSVVCPAGIARAPKTAVGALLTRPELYPRWMDARPVGRWDRPIRTDDVITLRIRRAPLKMTWNVIDADAREGLLAPWDPTATGRVQRSRRREAGGEVGDTGPGQLRQRAEPAAGQQQDRVEGRADFRALADRRGDVGGDALEAAHRPQCGVTEGPMG